ncbi:hypothetical protein QBC45DRAFT_478296 [Copromyces sp. CBS 386.78]|nr:hypothetical protein QBC45DRAFT_478296 [Copromyces sp. CBS 386.78]
MPSLNRKREREGGHDSGRSKKKSNTGVSVPVSSTASNLTSVAAVPEKPDNDILISPYDGHRRYDEWKGIMYGHPKVISGGGCLFPTNYQIDFRQIDPWTCPIADCRKLFPQPSQLGLHFSRAHRKMLLYDELYRGFFWPIGKRKTPDKDGRYRSIVVTRGYFAPDDKRDRNDVRQPPEDWESYVNPTAVKDIKPPNLPQPAAHINPSSMTPTTASASTSRPSATPTVVPPRVGDTPGVGIMGRSTGSSIHEVIDISSDEEDVKPSLAELQRESHSVTSGLQRVEAQREAQSSASNEADTQEDPFQDDPIEAVYNRDGSKQAPVDHQPLELVRGAVGQRRKPETSPIWTYMIKYAKSPTPIPADDAVIAELLTELPKRRDLPEDWKGRLAAFDTLSINQLSALILYLGGTTPVGDGFQYCSVMQCSLRKGPSNCPDATHNGGRCRTCGFTFPQCVFLPRYLLASVPIAKRFGMWLCCNSFYRNMPKFPDGVIESYTGKTMARREENGNSNTMSKERANNATPTKARACPQQQSSASFPNLAIQNRPKTSHQQRPKPASASSKKSSGTFCIPEGTPGQVFSLKGTETKLIQSSRNQILECKVLRGSGVKWQLVGGKEFKAYEGHWNNKWEIPPDSQCLVKNIDPKKSKELTCVDVNPKKGVVKAGQTYGMMAKKTC